MAKSKISGTVRPRPNADNIKYFDVILEMGRDPLTGKRKRVHYHVDTTDREEAENMLIMKQAEFLSGEMLMPMDKTVSSYLDEYMRDYVRVQSQCHLLNENSDIMSEFFFSTSNPNFLIIT